jgi:hypothetical protein
MSRLEERERTEILQRQHQQQQQQQQRRQAGLKRKKQILQEENRHKKALTKLIQFFVSIKLDLKIKPLKGQVGL